MENTALFTFCISTFKRPDFLRKTLLSIQAQSFKNFEVVISDNDLQQSAREVVENLKDIRFKYYANSENLGMIKSFNKSIERANTELIVMIADDDPVYPNMLETLYELYIAYPTYGVYHGGCDVIVNTPELAKTMRCKVGTNSCLSNDMSINEVKVISKDDFPELFFDGKINNYMLWSVGAVRKKILESIDFIPNYGTPFMGDLCYTVLTCSHSGVVFSNTSLGCQVVHGNNYGYVMNNDYSQFLITPDGFYQWVHKRMHKRDDWSSIEKKMQKFIARWVVGYAISTKKFLKSTKQDTSNFKKDLQKIFKIPYISKWKYKYYLAVYFPNLFELLLEIKKRYSKK